MSVKFKKINTPKILCQFENITANSPTDPLPLQTHKQTYEWFKFKEDAKIELIIINN